MAKNMPSHRAKFSRHSFDTSAGYTSTLCPAAIVPQYFDILQPGDTVYYKTVAFARLRDVVTAFLGEVDLHFDYFFVPLQMMFTPFGNVFFGINEPISDQLTNQVILQSGRFPTLNLSESINSRANSYLPNGWQYECWGKSVTRLLDAFDLNRYGVCTTVQAAKEQEQPIVPDDVSLSADSPNVSPWILAAYQAIYQKYYRNDDIERLDVRSYNFDSEYNASNTLFERQNMLYLRYVQRPYDYFTGLKISPIASAVNGNGSVTQVGEAIDNHGGSIDRVSYLSRVNNWLGTNSNGILYYESQNEGQDVNEGSYATAFKDEYSDSNITSNLRALFAVEKYMKIWGRADKTYDDQVLAHFGYKVPHDVKHQITHLKHNKMVIQSDPVYASGSAEYALGQVGGQASGSLTSDGDKFTASVHGVFMCVAYAVTKPRYQQTFNKLHMLSNRIDFPIPEYDKLGMQPLYGFEWNPLFMTNNETYQSQGFTYSARCGWQYRYNQFKQKYNRISLSFGMIDGAGKLIERTNPYQPWVLSRSPFELKRDYSYSPVYPFADYGLIPRALFENPHALDSVMVTEYNGQWSDIYFRQPNSMFDTDPIILEYLCDCKKVSWMSETGEPDL